MILVGSFQFRIFCDSMNFEHVKKTQLVTLKNRKKNPMMGQKGQYIHVGRSAALRNKPQAQHTNRVRT